MANPSRTSDGINIALISDIGGPLASATSFYYNIGSTDRGFSPTNSFGPGPDAVSKLVQSWRPSDVLAIGDLAYNSGSSTVLDASIGQYYNQFIHPYPAPAFLRDPYVSVNGQPVEKGRRDWPYNVYDYPKGFPNPVTGRAGGSGDGRNHFWGSPGNHDYGEFIGYGQVGVSLSDFSGRPIGDPIGPNSSSTDLHSFVDYVTPFLTDPALLGPARKRLNVGSADPTGNSGIYYSISMGGTVKEPLVEFFNLDTERLNINAGFEDWNPNGKKKYVDAEDHYYNHYEDNDEHSIRYNPAKRSSLPVAGPDGQFYTSNPENGWQQFQWLKRSLKQSDARWKVITGHHPVYTAGRWSDHQPDDHMSIPYMQRLLKALPKGAFDAYYNGHDHYYERVLESNDRGIGVGIPFITNGNSGRNLSKKIQVEYGTSVYEPTSWDPKNGDNPNQALLRQLLPSGPLSVASQGMGGDGGEASERFSTGLYGYGFGATQLLADDGYLLFQYREAPVVDPAIAHHLADGKMPERGFAGTVAGDWVPDPEGAFSGGKEDLAQFELSIRDGVVTSVRLLEGGTGYMASRGGNATVRGFNIYGNNVDPLQPWLDTAQVDLTFRGGELTGVELTDGGRGYELAVLAAWGDNTSTSTDGLPVVKDGKISKPTIKVPINFNLAESQYLVRDRPESYQDFHLTTDTRAIVHLQGEAGAPGDLRVIVKPESATARELLREQLKPTTYYSGLGAQTFRPRAQSGDIVIFNGRRELAKGALVNGEWIGSVRRLPSSGDPLRVIFSGDPISSYNVNFRPSDQLAVVRDSQKPVVDPSAPVSLEPQPAALPAAHGTGAASDRPWQGGWEAGESLPLAGI